MSYTNGLDNPELYFQTKLYTGNDSDNHSITLDGSENMQPDWLWIKQRGDAGYDHSLTDSVRGSTKMIYSSQFRAEDTHSTGVKSYDTDGFTLGTDDGSGGAFANLVNYTKNYVAWCWKAGGTAPAITYTVKVVSDSGNKYRFDDFGTSAVTLDLQEGGTYTFDQSDSSNSGHPLRFYTSSDKSGGEYTTGVTTTGTAGSSGAKTVITVAASAPTLYYQCSNHAGMGGQANTNSTFGSSNFGGSIQSTVSANTTAGFSIVKYTGTDGTATVGHNLGVEPSTIIFKCLDNGNKNWVVYDKDLTNAGSIYLDETSASSTSYDYFADTSPTSTVFTVKKDSSYDEVNNNGSNFIAYCFAEKKGYSKFGSYEGNGSTDGTFVYTGFRPAFVMTKSMDSTSNWEIKDNTRSTFNPIDDYIKANANAAEDTGVSSHAMDFLSNGFKHRGSNDEVNGSETYIYMAFAESPFVNSKSVPTNAR